MSRLSSRFSIGNRLARLSTNWGVPDALQRLGLVNPSAPVYPSQPHRPPQQSPIAEQASEESEQAVEATTVNSAEAQDAAEQAAAAAGSAEMAAGTAEAGSGAAAQAVAAAVADHDTAGQADDAHEQGLVSSEQLPLFELHCSCEDAAKQDAASPCTAQLTPSSSQRPQKENQQPAVHRSSLGAKKWTQQLRSPAMPSQDVRRITPAFHQSSASDLLALQQDLPQPIIPDTPDISKQAASDFYSRAATAADEGSTATGNICVVEDVAAGAAAQAADAGALEADVAAVSGQLSQLELTPMKQLLKLCGQDVSAALASSTCLDAEQLRTLVWISCECCAVLVNICPTSQLYCLYAIVCSFLFCTPCSHVNSCQTLHACAVISQLQMSSDDVSSQIYKHPDHFRL